MEALPVSPELSQGRAAAPARGGACGAAGAPGDEQPVRVPRQAGAGEAKALGTCLAVSVQRDAEIR